MTLRTLEKIAREIQEFIDELALDDGNILSIDVEDFDVGTKRLYSLLPVIKDDFKVVLDADIEEGHLLLELDENVISAFWHSKMDEWEMDKRLEREEFREGVGL